MSPKVIKSDIEYQKYLKYIESIFHKELSDEEAEETEIISILLENYEKSKQEPTLKVDDLPNLNYIYDLVRQVSSMEKSNITEKGLKLNEEVGELSAEILKLVKYKYTTDTEEEIRINLLGEAVDSLIMIFDILSHQKYSMDEIVDAGEQNISKWLNQINK